MAAVLPGYEYDVFISYRHNDNLNGWVTDFVQNLEKEIKGTLKHSVSIYFDTNPHDGLLETHSVDKSLEGKLKCLIFIPVISQTYCDPKSFAWQYEFCIFNKLAREDHFGREVKLSNGNVASRILPIKIHNLDADDQALLEKELGGVLRPIEFIFKAAGVNRPLEGHEDHPNDNTHRTFYRDQINKVANAIKDIITGLKLEPDKQPAMPQRPVLHEKFEKSFPARVFAIASICLIILLIGGYVLNKVLFNTNNDTDKSIAVLAFDDLSPQQDQEWFSDGLSEEILNSLSRLNELKVMARTSSFYFKGKHATITEIGEKLGVAHVVEGSVKRIDNQLRITVQLIRAKDGFHIWSQEYDRPAKDLFKVQTDIAENIAKVLLNKLTQRDINNISSEKPSNQQAYNHFLKGIFFHEKLRGSFNPDHFRQAEKEFLQAIALEPSYAAAYGELANLYDTYRNFGELKRYDFLRDSITAIAYRLNPHLPSVLAMKSICFLNTAKPTFDSAFLYLKEAYYINPEDAWVNSLVGLFYHFVGLSDLDLKFRQRAIDRDPLSSSHLRNLAITQYFYGDKGVEASIQKVLELDSANIAVALILADQAAENKDAALLERRIRNFKEVSMGEAKPFVDMMQGYLLALHGETQAALKLQFNDRTSLALEHRLIFYYLLNDKEKMVSALDSALLLYPEISYLELQQRIIFEPVRKTDKFQEILAKMKERDALMRRKYDVLDLSWQP